MIQMLQECKALDLGRIYLYWYIQSWLQFLISAPYGSVVISPFQDCEISKQKDASSLMNPLCPPQRHIHLHSSPTSALDGQSQFPISRAKEQQLRSSQIKAAGAAAIKQDLAPQTPAKMKWYHNGHVTALQRGK